MRHIAALTAPSNDHRLLDEEEPVVPRLVLLLPLALLAAMIVVSWAAFHGLRERLARYPGAHSSETAGTLPSRAQPVGGRADADVWPAFTPEVLVWAPSILRWSETYQLDLNLVALVMQLESCGNPDVLSPAGAIGLFQVMPFHFAPDEDPYDPETNAKRGLSYLARALTQASNQPGLALAGYNGGISVIASTPSAWPEETQRYVGWGQAILDEIAAGMTSSSTLPAWLDAGGARLCHLASQNDVITASDGTPHSAAVDPRSASFASAEGGTSFRFSASP